jgi:hypothetical protein
MVQIKGDFAEDCGGDMKERTCNTVKNLKRCTCTYDPCSRKGICCECIDYHWKMKQLPACFFPEDVERTYDRSLKRFIQCYGK